MSTKVIVSAYCVRSCFRRLWHILLISVCKMDSALIIFGHTCLSILSSGISRFAIRHNTGDFVVYIQCSKRAFMFINILYFINIQHKRKQDKDNDNTNKTHTPLRTQQWLYDLFKLKLAARRPNCAKQEIWNNNKITKQSNNIIHNIYISNKATYR